MPLQAYKPSVNAAVKRKPFNISESFDKIRHLDGSEAPETAKAAEKLKMSLLKGKLSAQAEASIYRDDLAERIPRSEAAEHMRFIAALVPSAIPAGSFRRGASTSNDLDIIVLEPIDKVVAALTKAGYIKHTFSMGAHKFSGIIKHPGFPRYRHLDIVMTTRASAPFALLYFTGSARHNIVLRLKARRMGLKLNEYGLFGANGKALPGLKSEEEIYKALGVPWTPPEAR